jgi:hypothetical protein
VNQEDLKNAIKAQQPFEPVLLHLSNGATFEIRHPDAILISPRTSAIMVGDAIHLIANVHINYIEPLALALG